MNSPLFPARYIPSLFKAKTQHKPENNRVRKRRIARNRSTRGEEGQPRPVAATTVRGGHWPPCSASLLVRCVLPFSLNRGFIPWVIHNGPFGLAFHPLFTWLDSKSYFSPKNLARIMLICNNNSTKSKPSIIGEIHA